MRLEKGSHNVICALNIEMKKISILLLKDLFVQIVISFILIIIFAFIAFKLNLSNEFINNLILIIYGISSFIGGAILGKNSDKRKFLWGLTAGIIYFLFILMISFISTGNIFDKNIYVLTKAFVSAICGMLGGMIIK